MSPSPPHFVGPQEIATLLGVKHATVKQWRHRRILPEPLAVISGVPIWRRSTIERWARSTGRLRP